MRVLVTGANGQLGRTFQVIASQYPEHDFFFANSSQLDITNSNSIDKAFNDINPEITINCAAYTAVDLAEDEPSAAFAVNAEAVRNLVDACKKYNAAIIHISTDYVFDGTGKIPYVETDPVNPLGIYGKSKRKGEEAILQSDISALIIRTSWVYSEFGNNFVKTMLRLGKERHELNVVSDQIGSPTYTYDLAHAVMRAINQQGKWLNSQLLYHFSNDGVCSWYDFALTIFEYSNIKCKVNPIRTEDYPTIASRPQYSVLNSTKIEHDFELNINHWKDSLKKALLSL